MIRCLNQPIRLSGGDMKLSSPESFYYMIRKKFLIRKRYGFNEISTREIGTQAGSDKPEPEVPSGFPTSGAIFTLVEEDDYSASDTWPETEEAFAVPAEDMPRVKAWFTNDYHGVTLPESVTLKKNMSTAVKSALSGYFTGATSRNLFTSPIRIGIAYRLFNGDLTPLQEISLLSSALSAPALPILSSSLTDKYLSTRVQVRNRPTRLHISFSPKVEIENFRDIITDVEIYATAQSPLYDPATNVAGIRTIYVDDTPRRCWYYESYPEEEIRAAVNSDSTFRLLHKISLETIISGDFTAVIPTAAGALSKFNSLPKYNSVTSDTTGNPGGGTATPGAPAWKPQIHFITEPLHLGYPDDDKRIRNVYLRGVFNRNDITFRLYGACHREDWRLICTSRRPLITGLCGIRYRWFRIEIESSMRREDFFDALTFEFTL